MFKEYEINAVEGAYFHTGQLKGLTSDQIRRRSTKLTKVSSDIHRIDDPVMFKRGEHINYDGEVNSKLMDVIEVKKETATKPNADAKDKETVHKKTSKKK